MIKPDLGPYRRLWSVFGALILVVVAVILFKNLTLEQIQAKHQDLLSFYRSYPSATVLLLMGAFVLINVFCLPGAIALSIGTGAVLGTGLGFVVVALGANLGTGVSFILARYLFQRQFVTWASTHHAKVFEKMTRKSRANGEYYLFSLRMLPVVPAFLVNIVFAVSPMRSQTFVGVSFLSSLPGALVYANAGTQLATLRSFSDVMRPEVILSFIAIAALPWVFRLMFSRFIRR